MDVATRARAGAYMRTLARGLANENGFALAYDGVISLVC